MSNISVEFKTQTILVEFPRVAGGSGAGFVEWANIENKPATFPPSAHGHTIGDVTNLQATLDGKAASIHGHAVGDVSGLQTALDGKAAASHGHAIGDVSGLQTALDGKSATGHGHAVSDVSGLQTALDGKAASVHGHSIAEVTGLQTALDAKAGSTHAGAHVTGGADKIRDASASQDGLMTAAQASKLDGIQSGAEVNVNADWNAATGDAAIINKPASFPPSVHGHAISDVSGLQTALDGKSATGHGHVIADVTGLQTALDGKASTSHSHGISDVTGLQTALDGKAASVHTHAIGDLTGVSITSPVNDQVFTFEASTGLWKNKTAAGGGGITNEQSIVNALIFG